MASFLGREIEYLLSPFGEARFFERHWERSLLHVSGRPGKWAEIYDVEAWETRRAFRDVKACKRDPRGGQEQFPIEASQVAAAFASGLTVCADVTADPKLEPFLGGFQERLRLAGGAPFAKLYASNDGAGFALHTDAHHVFVLQIQGSKRWRLSSTPAVSAPLLGMHLSESGVPVLVPPRHGELALGDDGAPLCAPDLSKLEAVVLEEGDCLYLPPGTWHTAEARGHSIAVSISPPRASVFSVIMRAIEDVLVQKPEWRRDVFVPPGEQHEPGRTFPSVEHALAARLADLRAALRDLDPRALHRVWRLNVRGRGGLLGAAPEKAESEPGVSTPIGRDEVLRRVPDVLDYLVAPSPEGGGDLVFFYHGASEWSFPVEALQFVNQLARTKEFRASDALGWDTTLTWEALHEVLMQLVDARILARGS